MPYDVTATGDLGRVGVRRETAADAYRDVVGYRLEGYVEIEVKDVATGKVLADSQSMTAAMIAGGQAKASRSPALT